LYYSRCPASANKVVFAMTTPPRDCRANPPHPHCDDRVTLVTRHRSSPVMTNLFGNRACWFRLTTLCYTNVRSSM